MTFSKTHIKTTRCTYNKLINLSNKKWNSEVISDLKLKRHFEIGEAVEIDKVWACNEEGCDVWDKVRHPPAVSNSSPKYTKSETLQHLQSQNTQQPHPYTSNTEK